MKINVKTLVRLIRETAFRRVDEDMIFAFMRENTDELRPLNARASRATSDSALDNMARDLGDMLDQTFPGDVELSNEARELLTGEFPELEDLLYRLYGYVDGNNPYDDVHPDYRI